MEKDKEAVALFQNKRQQIHCSQIIEAVNKERNLREKEFSHDSHHFKTKLWKLVQKRKELKLDPVKTRELEVYLYPGLKKKTTLPRARSKTLVPKPRGTVDEISVPKATDSNVFFVTKPIDLLKRDTVIRKAGQFYDKNSINKLFSKYPVLPPAKPIKQSNINTQGPGDWTKYAENHKNPAALTSDNPSLQVHSKVTSRGNDNTHERIEAGGKKLSFHEPLTRTSDDIANSPILTHNHARNATFFRRSASETNLKVSNVKQWLSVVDIPSSTDSGSKPES